MSDQRAMLDTCTNRRDCIADMHILACPSELRRAGVVVSSRRGGKNLRLIDQFNKVCPIGTHVLYWPGERTDEGRRSTTRSEAWLLGGHTPVVMVEGYAGGIALSHVMGIQPDEESS